MSEQQLKSLIMGLGQIGQGYDYDLDNQQYLLTHASALTAHPYFELVAGIDPCASARNKFETKFQKKAYSSLAELPSDLKPDFICIASPTFLHELHFQQALELSPKAILVEKPFGHNAEQAEKLIQKAFEQGCLVLVNYGRRFEPGVKQLKHNIEQKIYGKVKKGFVRYNKGLYNIGSHFINLLIFLLGTSFKVHLLSLGKGDSLDPHPDFILYINEIPIYFNATDFLDDKNTHLLEMELLTTKGKIQYLNCGLDIVIKTRSPHPYVKDYFLLDESYRIETELNKVQFYALSTVKELLDKRNFPEDFTDSIKTLAITKKIMNLLEVAHAE